MKKYLIGFVSALVLVGAVFIGRSFILGFFGSGGLISPDALNPAATEFGDLNVTVRAGGRPVANLEVDLGTPGGRMSNAVTNGDGVAAFTHVSVGTFNIFFNDLNFPQRFARVSRVPVQIAKDQRTEKTIELLPR
jgi:hypothetical protein